jgi:3-oxoadipate enol-lactonase
MRISGENLKVSFNDLTVNYDDNGPVYAPCVLFVHGTPFNKSIWDLQAEALKSNYRVVTYDLRGHGQTTATEKRPLSIDQFTDDLLSFMDALEIDKVMLCGHSMGGYIALDAVDKYPERFNALILTGTQCMEDSEETKTEREAIIRRLKDHGIGQFAEENMRSLFANTSFTTRKEEVRSVRKMILETNVNSVIDTLQCLSARRESCSNLWSIKMPVQIIVGREDIVTPPSAADFMHDNISGSTLSQIEYAGHLANLENTHEFNQIFRKFVDKVCQKKNLSRYCADETKPEQRNAGRVNKVI